MTPPRRPSWCRNSSSIVRTPLLFSRQVETGVLLSVGEAALPEEETVRPPEVKGDFQATRDQEYPVLLDPLGQ